MESLSLLLVGTRKSDPNFPIGRLNNQVALWVNLQISRHKRAPMKA
jgi:hypothetical protein